MSIKEKEEIKKFLLKISVDSKSFSSISSFRASDDAWSNIRPNMEKVINQNSNTYDVTRECNNVISPQQGENSSSASIQENNAVEILDGLMFILQDGLPKKEKNIIRSSVLTYQKNDVMSVFVAFQYIVKSYSRPNRLPHLVSCSENGLIKCDSNCPRYSFREFCGYTIAVALKNKTIESFASAFSKCNKKTTASVASQKIKNNVVGRKAPFCIKKLPTGSLEKFSSSAVTNTAIKIFDISNTTAAYDPPKTNNLSFMTHFHHHSF